MQTYVCPRCATTYTSLDAARLFDPAHNGFMCEECGCGISPATAPRTGLLRVFFVTEECFPR